MAPNARQMDLVPRSTRSVIDVAATHRLVRLSEIIRWEELIALVDEIRRRRLKSNAGRPPHLRANIATTLRHATCAG
jgi:hypothetical protein